MAKSKKQFFSLEINKNRIYGLDILRALAILFVVLGHGKGLLPENLHIYSQWLTLDGVSIFFVLSGFLIGGILIKILDQNKPSKKLLVDFWIRRWFRTLPNYFLILLVLLGFSFIYQEGVSFWEVKEYFIFSQNLFEAHPRFFPEAWSLSVEEWFYILTPIGIFSIIHFFKIKTKPAILSFAISIFILIFLFRFYRYSNLEIEGLNDWGKLFRKQVVTRLDSLMFGVIAAYIQFYKKELWLKHKRILLVIGILILVISKALLLLEIIPVSSFYNCVISFSVISIATALLLPYLSQVKSGSGKVYKTLSTISLISYSMYLLNLSVVEKNIIHKIPWDSFLENDYFIGFLQYSLYWTLTIFASILLYKYFEIPTTKLRDHPKVKSTLAKIFSK